MMSSPQISQKSDIISFFSMTEQNFILCVCMYVYVCVCVCICKCVCELLLLIHYNWTVSNGASMDTDKQVFL